MFEFLLLAFVSIFVIIDPFANVPVFVALLSKCDSSECRATIRTAVLVGFGVFILAGFTGNFVFDFLKIRMYSFEIAGGLLLFIIALEMLFGLKTRTEFSEPEKAHAREMEDIAVFPLAVPLITGPGAITTAIMLANRATTPDLMGQFAAAALLAFGIAYVILSRSYGFQKIVPPLALKTFTRVMGLLLAALAVQFVTNGVAAFVATL